MLYLKKLTQTRMAIIPMAIFVLALIAAKMGPIGSHILENPARAAISAKDLSVEEHVSSSLLQTMQTWRDHQQQRSRIFYNPAYLSSLTADELGSLLGKPALRREDGDAHMVQYVAGDCIAEFYYSAQGPQTISYYEFRNTAASHGKLSHNDSCLQTILGSL